MNRFAAAAGLAALTLAGPAAAITITLVTLPPTPASLTVGDSVFVEVGITGLGAAGAPSLTSFEFDITFSDAVLDFVNLGFGTFLGPTTCTPATFGPSCDAFAESSHTPGSGLLVLGEATLFALGDVNANQPAAGVLATLEFTVAAAGSTTLSLAVVALHGTLGGTAEEPLSAAGAFLPVTVPAVPEPAPGILIALGLAGLAARLRRRCR